MLQLVEGFGVCVVHSSNNQYEMHGVCGKLHHVQVDFWLMRGQSCSVRSAFTLDTSDTLALSHYGTLKSKGLCSVKWLRGPESTKALCKRFRSAGVGNRHDRTGSEEIFMSLYGPKPVAGNNQPLLITFPALLLV